MELERLGRTLTFRNSDRPIDIPETVTLKPFRAWWVSNVLNIDLPTMEDTDLYRHRVIRMLDEAKRWGMTAIFFQVRTTSDAFYRSNLNPYSRYLTGKEGKTPPFDAFMWVIEEAKKRAIECHAWMNPYRVSVKGDLSKEDYLATCDDRNFAKRHPEHVLVDRKGLLILNPARKAVKDHIVETMVEVARNYPIDGIHFDDYFYPYAGGIDDEADYLENSNAYRTKGDFRRAQVTEVIRRVRDAVKSVDPGLRFGISPFGIWRNEDVDPRGSNTDPKCSQSYDDQYADTRSWVKEKLIDYIVPQIYWGFAHPLAPFADLVNWWADLCAKSEVDLYIGHGVYRLGNKPDYLNPLETVDQVRYANHFPAVKGNVFFTYHTFVDHADDEAILALKESLDRKSP
ncbi:MAG: glycoside hydrolase family 10 protein [Acholeplasmataceae bacterium]